MDFGSTLFVLGFVVILILAVIEVVNAGPQKRAVMLHGPNQPSHDLSTLQRNR